MARTQVTRPMLSSGAREKLLVFRIYDPAVRTEPLVLSLPWDGEILSASWETDDANNLDFNIDLDGTPISWTTAAGTALAGTSTSSSDTAASANTFSAGDDMQIDITGLNTGTPAYMQLEIFLRIAEEDA